MTHHLEDAMTRERALEEAWRAWLATGPQAVNMRHAFEAGFAAALASAQQEQEPAADADYAARIAVIDAAVDSTDAIVKELREFGINVAEFRLAIQSEIKKAINAALRRYAGDGGVTDDQVDAACRSMADGVLGVIFDDWADDAKQSYRPHMRAALEAAARAKSGEKGGANV